MGHPAVKEACVVGIPHPKWQERPLAAVVLKDGKKKERHGRRAAHFSRRGFAKWSAGCICVVDAIPRTSVGKFKKIALESSFAGWKWDRAAE